MNSQTNSTYLQPQSKSQYGQLMPQAGYSQPVSASNSYVTLHMTANQHPASSCQHVATNLDQNQAISMGSQQMQPVVPVYTSQQYQYNCASQNALQKDVVQCNNQSVQQSSQQVQANGQQRLFSKFLVPLLNHNTSSQSTDLQSYHSVSGAQTPTNIQTGSGYVGAHSSRNHQTKRVCATQKQQQQQKHAGVYQQANLQNPIATLSGLKTKENSSGLPTTPNLIGDPSKLQSCNSTLLEGRRMQTMMNAPQQQSQLSGGGTFSKSSSGNNLGHRHTISHNHHQSMMNYTTTSFPTTTSSVSASQQAQGFHTLRTQAPQLIKQSKSSQIGMRIQPANNKLVAHHQSVVAVEKPASKKLTDSVSARAQTTVAAPLQEVYLNEQTKKVVQNNTRPTSSKSSRSAQGSNAQTTVTSSVMQAFNRNQQQVKQGSVKNQKCTKLQQVSSTGTLGQHAGSHQSSTMVYSQVNGVSAHAGEAQEDIHMSVDKPENTTSSDMGSHLVQQNAVDKQASINSTMPDSQMMSQQQLSSMQEVSLELKHPSISLSRVDTTEIERQNVNINIEYAQQIDDYTRQLESDFQTQDCLNGHKITPALRARMIDWMIEVLTNFKCEDQTFFLAANLLDRFLKNVKQPQEIADLHLMGVTAMFIASKYEDIQPLKMKMVYEKIAHKKLQVDKIKQMELAIMKTIHYKIPAPTALDFLKIYLKYVLGIGHLGNTSLKKEEKEALPTNSDTEEGKKLLVLKMSLYLAKMSMHDYELAGRKSSLIAVGSLYVALKICEQLKRIQLITQQVVTNLVKVSRCQEAEIIEVSQKVLYLAQNFDKAFPGLENLKKSHFVVITQLL